MTSMRMKPLDAVWLSMESPDTPMHVGVLAIFEKPRKAPADYLSQWAEQMREVRHPAEPWAYCLSGGKPSLLPKLEEEPEFDLEYHFRHSALPQPGGERELGVMVSRLHSHPLDRSRPLWEFHLIEGLERDRFAFYVKVHHALVDNVNGIPMLLSMLTDNAQTRDMPPLWEKTLHSGAGSGPEQDSVLAFRNSRNCWSPWVKLPRVSAQCLRVAPQGSFLLPAGTPRSTLNRHINAQRRFATQQIEQRVSKRWRRLPTAR